MGTKLYVGNLSYDTTEDQIRTLFAQAGEIGEIAFITDRDTGRPKGFGFVTMKTEEGAQEAIKRFNGQPLDNRNLTVSEARPREERSGGSGGRGGFGGGNSRGGSGGRGRF
jgi:cold-inducible RNA-binding protein